MAEKQNQTTKDSVLYVIDFCLLLLELRYVCRYLLHRTSTVHTGVDGKSIGEAVAVAVLARSESRVCKRAQFRASETSVVELGEQSKAEQRLNSEAESCVYK